jgi:hypothetical protein
MLQDKNNTQIIWSRFIKDCWNNRSRPSAAVSRQIVAALVENDFLEFIRTGVYLVKVTGQS